MRVRQFQPKLDLTLKPNAGVSEHDNKCGSSRGGECSKASPACSSDRDRDSSRPQQTTATIEAEKTPLFTDRGCLVEKKIYRLIMQVGYHIFDVKVEAKILDIIASPSQIQPTMMYS